MQKTTLFTIFFSVLVVTLLAEFMTSNQLKSGWTSVIPASGFDNETESDDKNVASESDNSGVISEDTSSAATPSAQSSTTNPLGGATPSQDAPPSADAPKVGEVAQFLNNATYILERLNGTQLQQMGFEQMHMERVSADGLLFQLLDTADTVNLSKVRFHLSDGKNVYGVLSEYLLADEKRAATFYGTLKQKASLFAPAVKLNETNSFGAASFYLNDEKRQGTAFLTVLAGNRVFAFSYPKASHEYFKKMITLLTHSLAS